VGRVTLPYWRGVWEEEAYYESLEKNLMIFCETGTIWCVFQPGGGAFTLVPSGYAPGCT